jgi:hypothetical protein
VSISLSLTAPVVEIESKASTLGPAERVRVALDVISGGSPTEVARAIPSSRKFVYQQVNTARSGIQKAFVPEVENNEKVLFTIKVTKSLIQQMVLVLLLRCHAPYRGIMNFFLDLFGYRISIGRIHNIAVSAMTKAKNLNDSVDLNLIKAGAQDEIYQAQKPVLVGVDQKSYFTYLLALADSCDTTTWGVHILDLVEQGFAPDHIVADLGGGQRAGLEEAIPGTPCHADVFHILKDIGDILRHYLKKLEATKALRQDLEEKMLKMALRGKDQRKYSSSLGNASEKESNLFLCVEKISILFSWLHHDILCLAGPAVSVKEEMFEFILQELQMLSQDFPRLKALATTLKKRKKNLLAPAVRIDNCLNVISEEMGLPKHLLEGLVQLQEMNLQNEQYYRFEVFLRQHLGQHFYTAQCAIRNVLKDTFRASSPVENINSILRDYFFLRHHVGTGYLNLLQFYLNHRKFDRSESPDRQGKSPREVLEGKSHSHWLELLGFQRLLTAA